MLSHKKVLFYFLKKLNFAGAGETFSFNFSSVDYHIIIQIVSSCWYVFNVGGTFYNFFCVYYKKEIC